MSSSGDRRASPSPKPMGRQRHPHPEGRIGERVHDRVWGAPLRARTCGQLPADPIERPDRWDDLGHAVGSKNKHMTKRLGSSWHAPCAPEAANAAWPAYHGRRPVSATQTNLMMRMHRSMAGRPMKPVCGARYDGVEGTGLLDNLRTSAGLGPATPGGDHEALSQLRRRPVIHPSSSQPGGCTHMEPREARQIPTRSTRDRRPA